VGKRFIELRETIKNQEVKDSFVRKVVIVPGKTGMCVVGLMPQIGFLEKKLIET
jgi:hypothetical protein